MKLTLDIFKMIPYGEVFASGILPNNEKGLFMNRDKGYLRWVAKKGRIDDWAIYCHWIDKPFEFILSNGDKIASERNIRRCISCTDEVFNKYRY